jgi:hypothetical protein
MDGVDDFLLRFRDSLVVLNDFMELQLLLARRFNDEAAKDSKFIDVIDSV